MKKHLNLPLTPKVLFPALVMGVSLSAACGFQTGEDPEPTPGDTRGTGLALTVDVQGGTDVAGFRFDVWSCAGAKVSSRDVDLEDLRLPGMIPAFENAPFAANSSHLFADYFQVLPAGCYDVTVTPLQSEGAPSQACTTASASGVEVSDGTTREVLLISQCEGPERGALDVVAALNHPPVIESLNYTPSKFVYECAPAIICASASDANGDPLDFRWLQESGPVPFGGPSIVKAASPDASGLWTECISVVPSQEGDHMFRVEIFDVTYDSKGHKEYISSSSMDQLSFPLYSADNGKTSCKPKKGHGGSED